MTSDDEIDYRDVPPDPAIADAIGRTHTLGTALADLVDNSIDAGASHVRIRFLQHGDRLSGLLVIDDGGGMDARTIDAAMVHARRRDYDVADLGHFGLGLKAASLSQADELDVYSLAEGSPAVARRLRADHRTRIVEIDPHAASRMLSGDAARMNPRARDTGTVVVWRHVRTFPSAEIDDEQRRWLDATIVEISEHLGLVLHRLLAAGRIDVTIDQFDLDDGAAGAVRRVTPLDPFGYGDAPGDARFALRGSLEGRTFELDARVWPPALAGSAAFRAGRRQPHESQGFYVYRRDRLIQAGGWNGIIAPSRERDLARATLDIGDELLRHASINPEKSGVELGADLRSAIEAAVDDRGCTFRDYLEAASRGAVASRRRTRRPVSLIRPARGFDARLLGDFDDLVEFSDFDPISIRWRVSRSESLVEFDFDGRTLWLNTRYRPALGSPTGDPNDAPLLKTLLWMLYSRLFEGRAIGAREKQELETWQPLITAALERQLERAEYGE